MSAVYNWEEQLAKARKKYIAIATKEDPAGATCGRCGKPNDFADDCGWFGGNAGYWRGAHPEWDGVIMCESCWRWSGSNTGER